MALMLLVAMLFTLAACGTPECPPHNDPDADKICNTCGNPINDGEGNGDDDDNNDITPISYTVTIKDDYTGSPIQGLKVKFLYEGKETEVYTTDANGKATAEIPSEREIKIALVDLEGYGAPTAKKSTFDLLATELTVELKPIFSVIVRDADGNGIAGVELQLCDDKSCLPFPDTDENGRSEKPTAPTGTAKIQINSVPAGYKMPDPVTGTYHAIYDADAREVIIILEAE